MASIKRIAEAEGIIVVATIHAPSIETLQLFDQMMVLAKGKVAFRGTLNEAEIRCRDIGHPIRPYYNPADHLLDLVASDFGDDKTPIVEALYASHIAESEKLNARDSNPDSDVASLSEHMNKRGLGHQFRIIGVLCERNVVNYSR